MSEISPISSSCKLCLFAKYDGDTQIGCEFNRTEKIHNHPLYELIEATDNDKNFYVLNNHICPYQRTEHWIHADSENKIALVKKEVYMKWAAILIAHNQTLDVVEQRLQEIDNQSIKPSVITLVLDKCVQIEEVFKIMDRYSSLWYLHNNLEDDVSDRFIIDVCFEKMKRHKFLFYGVFDANLPVENNFYDRIHQYVIEDMHQYGVIKNADSLHQMVVSKLIHTKYSGNSGIDLEEKILAEGQLLEKEQKTYHKHFVLEYSQI